jgi:hypothetical protein
MAHGESALPLVVATGIAGGSRANPQRRTNAFPALTVLVQNPAFGVGVFLGIGFSVAGATWLLLANRVPHLDQFAGERNVALGVAFALLGIVPTCRFTKSPGRNFLSGVTGWAILTTIYSVAELIFPRLATRLSAFHLFVLGCTLFGLLAALAWVVNLVIIFRRARQQPIGGRIGLRYAASSR